MSDCVGAGRGQIGRFDFKLLLQSIELRAVFLMHLNDPFLLFDRRGRRLRPVLPQTITKMSLWGNVEVSRTCV